MTIPMYNSVAAAVLSYVLQLVHPSKHVLMAERRMHSRVLKVPFNSWPTLATYELQLLGIRRIVSIADTSVAAKYRLVHSFHDELLSIYDDFKKLYDCFTCANFHGWRPVGWDSDSFSWTLLSVVRPRWIGCSISDCSISNNLLRASKARNDICRLVRSGVSRCRARGKRIHVQPIVYKHLSKTRPKMLIRNLDRKAKEVFGAERCEFEWGSEFNRLPSHHLRWQAFKTFSCAWLTSCRTRQEFALCIFCGAVFKDSIRHYIHCSAMFDILNDVLPGMTMLDTPAQSFGLGPTIGRRVLGAALASLLYHECRYSERVTFREGVDALRRVVASDPVLQKEIILCTPTFFPTDDDACTHDGDGDDGRMDVILVGDDEDDDDPGDPPPMIMECKTVRSVGGLGDDLFKHFFARADHTADSSSAITESAASPEAPLAVVGEVAVAGSIAASLGAPLAVAGEVAVRDNCSALSCAPPAGAGVEAVRDTSAASPVAPLASAEERAEREPCDPEAPTMLHPGECSACSCFLFAGGGCLNPSCHLSRTHHYCCAYQRQVWELKT